MRTQEYDLTYNDLNPTFLFSCNLERVEDETNYHAHDFVELSIITKGTGVYHIDGVDYPVSAGDLVVFNPGTYHKSLVTNPDYHTTEHYIGFSDIHLRGQKANTLILPGNVPVYSMSGKMKQEVLNICNRMAKESAAASSGRYFLLKAYLIELIVLILREVEDTASNHKGYVFESPYRKYVVSQMINFFNDHFSEKISLDQIAQNMYLSTFYLAKIFKSETGDTPINYLINLRLEKARELLEEDSSASIQDIAEKVGYEDVSHFSKSFKKHYGIAPTKYRSDTI